MLCLHCTEKPAGTDAMVDVNANVVDVKVSGAEGNYTFNVTLSSPDTGCDQYADWWEVISESGELLYRRILLHSHVNEQPFTRSGGPVEIAADQMVWIRAHMNNGGYGGNTFKGSATSGFTGQTMPDGFAQDLEKEEPQPGDCTF